MNKNDFNILTPTNQQKTLMKKRLLQAAREEQGKSARRIMIFVKPALALLFVFVAVAVTGTILAENGGHGVDVTLPSIGEELSVGSSDEKESDTSSVFDKTTTLIQGKVYEDKYISVVAQKMAYFDNSVLIYVTFENNCDGEITVNLHDDTDSGLINSVNGIKGFSMPYTAVIPVGTKWGQTFEFEYDTLLAKGIDKITEIRFLLEVKVNGDKTEQTVTDWIRLTTIQHTTNDLGIDMNVTVISASKLSLTLGYSPKLSDAYASLATSCEYEIMAVHNGSVISFGDYMRDVLGKDYQDMGFAWDAVLLPLYPDSPSIFEIDLSRTYGELPPGDYVLCKSVYLSDPDELGSTCCTCVHCCAEFSIE